MSLRVAVLNRGQFCLKPTHQSTSGGDWLNVSNKQTFYDFFEVDKNDDNPNNTIFQELTKYFPSLPRSKVESDMVPLGTRICPFFDVKKNSSSYYFLSLGEKLEKEDIRSISASEAINQFKQAKINFSTPHILQILRNYEDCSSNITQFVEKCNNQSKDEYPEDQSKLEFVNNIEFIPIKSNTLPPFTHTNLVLIRSKESAMIVDPGANAEGERQFKKILQQLPKSLTVFITHHHHDHIEAIPMIEKLRPDAVLMGDPKTLNRIESKLASKKVNDGDTIPIGEVNLQVIACPGHTDGHTTLFEPKTKSIIAGDHVVGIGSSVLDFSNGSMSQYFQSTEKMISLQPQFIFPSHGPPHFNAVDLLKYFLKHRIDRENQIIASIAEGNNTIDDIVKSIYRDIPESLFNAAKSNVRLHLIKLKEDGRIPNANM